MRLDLAADPLVQQKVMSGTLAAVSGVGSWFTADWPAVIFGVPLSVLLAGFAGAVIALSFLPPEKSFVRMLSSVGLGTVAAAYTTPLVAASLAKVLDTVPQLGVAFLIGLGAKAGIPMIPKLLGDAREILKKRFGGGEAGK